MMSRFLEDFAEYIKENNGKVFAVAEIVGNELPKKIVIKENNAYINSIA